MTLLNLYDADSSKAIDALVIKRFKIDSVELMRRAGQRALVTLLENFGSSRNHFCSPLVSL